MAKNNNAVLAILAALSGISQGAGAYSQAVNAGESQRLQGIRALLDTGQELTPYDPSQQPGLTGNQRPVSIGGQQFSVQQPKPMSPEDWVIS